MTKYDDRKIDWTGKVMNDKYVLIKKIGFGSYATVWLSYDLVKHQYVAIKISNRRDILTAINEVINYKTIEELKSKYLIKPIEIFEHENNFYDDDEVSIEHNKHHCIVMELLGSSLYGILKTQHYKSNVKYVNIINILKQVLMGLYDLHEHNIIHGDIKPENILIKNSTNQYNKTIKMLDLNKIKGKKKIIDHIIKKQSKLNSKLSDDSSSSLSEYSDNISEFSYFSSDYDKLELSSDEGYDDDYNDDDHSEYKKEHESHKFNYSDLNIQIVDYGECHFPKMRKKREVQTCYYKSPEILLWLPYTTSSDMWAFGCMMIELLTQTIMFDADEYDGNNERHHLYLINCCFGNFPKAMINKSPRKDIFFSKDLNRIKGYNKIDDTLNINSLIDVIKTTYEIPNIFELSDFINKVFDYNNETRITAKDALNHNLFK